MVFGMANAFAKKKRNAFSSRRSPQYPTRRDRVSYMPQHSARHSRDPVERAGGWGKRIAVALAVIMIGGALYLLFISTIFRVFAVTVSGNYAVSTGEITTLLDQETSGRWLGVFSKHNILFIHPSTTEQLLRTQFPELATVTVTKSFIAGGKWRPTLSVQVTERQIFGIWCNAQGNSPQQSKIFHELSTGATAPQNFTATTLSASSPASTPFSTAGTINVFRDFYQSVDLMSTAMSTPSTAATTFGTYAAARAASVLPPGSINCFYFDQGGVIFQSAPQPEGYLIFTIFNVSSQKFILGDDPISSAFIKDVSDIYSYLQNFDALRPLYAISNSDNPNFVAIKVMPSNTGQGSTPLSSGFYVFLDLHTDYHAALANLTTALAATLKGQINTLNYVDLRVPGRLYYATNP